MVTAKVEWLESKKEYWASLNKLGVKDVETAEKHLETLDEKGIFS